MNDAVFLFAVLPLTLCFVVTVFLLVYSGDLLGWYREQLAAQRKAPPRLSSAAHAVEWEETQYVEPKLSRKEMELVSH